MTFNKDIAPIFQAKCQSCHEPGSIAPMSLTTWQESRPSAKSIRARVASRQMPPWHIDQSVGVPHFENDMSLPDEQIATILTWVDQGAPQGNPADFKAKPVAQGLYCQAERDGYGPPDLVIAAPMQTMPAVHQDVWWRPSQAIPIAEPRWVRMVEIRPANLPDRKILHHSIAYHVLDKDNVAAVNTGVAIGGRSASATGGVVAPAELVNRRPQLMEWAIGKGYDRFMDGTGKPHHAGQGDLLGSAHTRRR